MDDRAWLEEQANRLELVSRWADDLAHEIKNPLHAMVINLELVKRRAGAEDTQPLIERAEVVESELHRVHSMVDSLLRLVRPWPDTTTASLDELFDALLPVFKARAAIRQVDYQHEPGGAIVAMPPGDLALVLVNLVDNAIAATPVGGRVLTAVRLEETGATVTVTDTGPGPPELEDRSTDSGVGEAKGPGLGLVVSRRLIGRAGGSLAMEPGPEGSGTRVVLELPRTGPS